MNNYADEIKERVPLLDLLHFYGFHPVQDRMPCPFHAGKDRNMLVSKNIYKCFVCGEHGDAISFVERNFGLDFQDAIAKINDDFRLGLPIGRELSKAEQADADARNAERRQRLSEKEQRRKELEGRYKAALEKYCACDAIIMRCAPISPATGFTDAFCWAVRNREAAWQEVVDAQAAIFHARKEESV